MSAGATVTASSSKTNQGPATRFHLASVHPVRNKPDLETGPLSNHASPFARLPMPWLGATIPSQTQINVVTSLEEGHMVKHRGTPSGLRAIRQQRTASEIERERELRNLQEEAAKKRHEEGAAKQLRRAAGISSMKKGGSQPLVAEPRELMTSQKELVMVAEAGRSALPESECQPCTTQPPPIPVDAAVSSTRQAGKVLKKQLRARSSRRSVLGPKSTVPTRLGITAEDFCMDRQLRRCKEVTVDGYRRDIAAFVRWLEEHGILEPAQITAQHARQFLFEIDSRQVSAWTLRHYIGSLRAFCNFLVGEGILVRTPMANIRMPRLPVELPESFTVNEMQLLLAAAQNSKNASRDVAIILALLDTGCRCSEFLSLMVGDVDLQTGQVTVR